MNLITSTKDNRFFGAFELAWPGGVGNCTTTANRSESMGIGFEIFPRMGCLFSLPNGIDVGSVETFYRTCVIYFILYILDISAWRDAVLFAHSVRYCYLGKHA